MKRNELHLEMMFAVNGDRELRGVRLSLWLDREGCGKVAAEAMKDGVKLGEYLDRLGGWFHTSAGGVAPRGLDEALEAFDGGEERKDAAAGRKGVDGAAG